MTAVAAGYGRNHMGQSGQSERWTIPALAAELRRACGTQPVTDGLSLAGTFAEEERTVLDGLLTACGAGPVFWHPARGGWETLVQAPSAAPCRGAAVLYRAASPEEAGCAALTAEEAGLRGAAVCFLPGGAALLTSFGGGTASAVVRPEDAAFPPGAAQSFAFEAALFLYGAAREAALLAAADRVRRALRDRAGADGKERKRP